MYLTTVRRKRWGDTLVVSVPKNKMLAVAKTTATVRRAYFQGCMDAPCVLPASRALPAAFVRLPGTGTGRRPNLPPNANSHVSAVIMIL